MPSANGSESMRLLELRAENFLRLKAIALRPGRNYVEIMGENGAGKTSVLRALQTLFSGKRSVPDEPVRYGTESATIVGDTGEYRIELEIAPNRETKLRVTGKDGVLKAGQTLLDRFREDRSFDPGDLMELNDKDFAAMLRALVGLDTRPLEIEHGKLYAERTAVNKRADQLAAMAGLMPCHADVGTEPVSTAELAAKHKAAREIAAANAAAIRDRDQLGEIWKRQLERVVKLDNEAREQCKAYDAAFAAAVPICEKAAALTDPDMASLEAELAAIQAKIKAAYETRAINTEIRDAALRAKEAAERAKVDYQEATERAEKAAVGQREIRAKLNDLEAKAESFPDPGLDAIEAEMAAADSINAKVAANKARQAKVDEAAAAKEESAALTQRLKEIEAAKAAMLAGAEFPIDGLTVDGDTVRFGGAPRSQWSEAESLRVCFAIQAARHPQLAVAIFKRGAAFTPTGRETIRALAEQYDMQAWLEVPSDTDGGTGFIIEDGTLAGEPAKAKAER